MIEALTIILAASLPAFIYCFIVWMTMPYKAISIKQSIMYFSFGFLSIAFLKLMWYFFPTWFQSDWQVGFLGNGDTDKLYTLAFFKVGYPEEIVKWLAFILISKWILFEKIGSKPNAIATMFYCGITALSFGWLENIQYAHNYGIEVLFSRTFTSLIFHFLCGLTIGYWVAMGEQKFDGRSVAGMLMNNHINIKRIIYHFIGITIAAYVHGIYDFNLFLMGAYGYPLLFLIMGMYSFVLFIASKHLISLTHKE